MDLIAPLAINQLAAVLAFGAKKYDENNWRLGLHWSRVIAAVLRHIFSWVGGETNDPESGLSHLAHAMCGIMFLLEYEGKNLGVDDRWKDEK